MKRILSIISLTTVLLSMVVTASAKQPQTVEVDSVREATYQRASEAYDKGDYEIAAHYMEQCLTSAPEFSRGSILLGYCYLEMGKYKKAYMHASEAIHVAKRRHDKKAEGSLHLLRSRIIPKIGGSPSDALKDANLAVRMLPNNTACLKERAMINLDLGHPKRSIKDLKKANKIMPFFDDLHFYLGYAYQVDGQLKKGIEEYSEAFRQTFYRSTATEILTYRAWCKCLDGQLVEAVEDILMAYEIDTLADGPDLLWRSHPELCEAFNNGFNEATYSESSASLVVIASANLYMAMENWQTAIDLYSIVEDIYPYATTRMARCYYSKGDYQSTIDILVPYLTQHPDEENVQQLLNDAVERLRIFGDSAS